MAGRAALSGTPEVRYGAKGRALLQRSAASGQALIVKLPWISVAGRYRSRQAKLFSFSVGLTDTPVPLPLGEVSPKMTERANKNRAVGNVRTCGAVYLLEEIVLVNNNWLNPVWIIEIVYFIQRKKSTQVGKITNYNKKTP